MKLRGTCEACHKTKWLIRKRKVKLPIGSYVTSQALICGQCFSPKTKKTLES